MKLRNFLVVALMLIVAPITHSASFGGERAFGNSTAFYIDPNPVSASPYRDAVLADNPWGFWPMDDAIGTSTIVDVSGNGRDWTITGTSGSPTWESAELLPGDPGSTSLDCDGASYLTFTGSWPSGLTAYTAEIVAATDTTGTQQWLSVTYTGFQAALAFARISNSELIYTMNTSLALDFFSAGTHHYAITCNVSGGLCSAFKDGVKLTSDQATPTSWQPTSPTAVFCTNFSDVLGQRFNGRVSHFAIYATRLSDADVLAHFEASGL